MKNKRLIAATLLATVMSEMATAKELTLSLPSERLLAIAGVSKKDAEAFLVYCQRQDFNTAVEAENPDQVFRKWSFGEGVSTLTEVKLFASRVLIANWVVRKSGETANKWECFPSHREFGADVTAELKKYAKTQFEDPLPVSMSGEFDYKSSSGFELLEVLQRKDGESISWAVRTPFLVRKSSYQDYTQQTLRIARLLNLPSF